MIPYLSKASPSSLKGIALVRLDFNTEDATRMKAVLGTITLLEKTVDKIVILSHAGRPNGVDPRWSLEGKIETFGKLLQKPIRFISHFDFPKIRDEVHAAPSGTIFALENLRFLPGEAENSDELGKSLASLGDFYVNDAFPVSHREAASIVAITKYTPHYAGLRMEAELITLTAAMEEPEHPLAFILGGAKATDKLGVLENFAGKADSFLLAGTPANTLLAMQGVDVMQSVRETDKTALEALAQFAKNNSVTLPVDWKWGDQRILDIGTQTIELFREKINEAKTIIWNGPVGLFEQSGFEGGTKTLIETLVSSKARVIVGGGETLTAFYRFSPKNTDADPRIFLSTGGGAMLEFLAGKKLPGLTALKS